MHNAYMEEKTDDSILPQLHMKTVFGCDDLLAHILGFLSLPTLLQAQQACTEWARVVDSNRAVWHSLRVFVNSYAELLSREDVVSVLQKHGRHVYDLAIDADLAAAARHQCTSVHTLRIRCTRYLIDGMLRQVRTVRVLYLELKWTANIPALVEGTMDGIEELYLQCTSVPDCEAAALGCRHLRRLRGAFSPRRLLWIIRGNPALEFLQLDTIGKQYWKDDIPEDAESILGLRQLVLTSSAVYYWIPTLRIIHGLQSYTGPIDKSILDTLEAGSAGTLEILHQMDGRVVPDYNTRHLTSFRELRDVDINVGAHLLASDLLQFLEEHPALCTVRISAVSLVDDVDDPLPGSRFGHAKLQTLVLGTTDGCYGMSMPALLRITAAVPSLTSLEIQLHKYDAPALAALLESVPLVRFLTIRSIESSDLASLAPCLRHTESVHFKLHGAELVHIRDFFVYATQPGSFVFYIANNRRGDIEFVPCPEWDQALVDCLHLRQTAHVYIPKN